MSTRSRPRMPTEVTPETTWFDRFAEGASHMASRAWFFAACVLIVMVWAPSYWLFGNVDTWQLVINTATTIVTFLLVALLQNSQRRGDQATQHKLNAVAAGLAEVMRERSRPDEPAEATAVRMADARRELTLAVGLEERESA